MKKVFAIRGISSKGKSSTIRSVYKKLETFPTFKLHLHPNLQPHIPQKGDIYVVLNINEKLIGIESQGDPNCRLAKSLEIFIKLECHIIICATRTRGGTHDAVENLNKKYGYEITWIDKKASDKKEDYEKDNEALAEEIVEKISNLLK